MSANGTQTRVRAGGDYHEVRPPGPSHGPEGEAFNLVTYTVAPGRLKGKVVWLVPTPSPPWQSCALTSKAPKRTG